MGYLFALAASLLFGANGSLTKEIVEAGLTATQLTQFRTLGTAIIAGALLLITNRRGFRLTRRQLFVMAVLGVFGVAFLQASYAFALSLMPVGITLLLEYTAVLMVALFAFFVFQREGEGAAMDRDRARARGPGGRRASLGQRASTRSACSSHRSPP